jgi:flagellar biosynthesis protein FlhA
MAINSGMVTDEVDGVPTKEPAFGLDALWISKDKKTEAIEKGYTTIEPSTIMSTHVEEVIKRYAEELLTRQNVKELLERLGKAYPALVEEANNLDIGVIQGVLRALLHEKVPIKDLVTILEITMNISKLTMEVSIITEQVRVGLARTITDMYKDTSGKINMLMLETSLEQTILTRLNENPQVMHLGLDNDELTGLIDDTKIQINHLLNMGISPPIIIVDPSMRKQISDTYEKFGLSIVVLSHAEIDKNVNFEVMGRISLNQADNTENDAHMENNDMFQ